jgi:hypothetical protein
MTKTDIPTDVGAVIVADVDFDDGSQGRGHRLVRVGDDAMVAPWYDPANDYRFEDYQVIAWTWVWAIGLPASGVVLQYRTEAAARAELLASGGSLLRRVGQEWIVQ